MTTVPETEGPYLVCSGLFKIYKVDPDTPYGKLPARFKKILWQGAGTREFDFRWKGRRLSYAYRKRWQGILALLERRYRDTGSEARRQELEKLMAVHPCPACAGAVREGDRFCAACGAALHTPGESEALG